MANEKDAGAPKRKPYVKPLLILHGSLTFLATQAEIAAMATP